MFLQASGQQGLSCPRARSLQFLSGLPAGQKQSDRKAVLFKDFLIITLEKETLTFSSEIFYKSHTSIWLTLCLAMLV